MFNDYYFTPRIRPVNVLHRPNFTISDGINRFPEIQTIDRIPIFSEMIFSKIGKIKKWSKSEIIPQTTGQGKSRRRATSWPLVVDTDISKPHHRQIPQTFC